MGIRLVCGIAAVALVLGGCGSDQPVAEEPEGGETQDGGADATGDVEPAPEGGDSAEAPEGEAPDEAAGEESAEAEGGDVLPFDRIRLVAPFDAGGGIDRAARQIQPYLGEALGKEVVVENIPGGNTAVGTTAVVRSEDCSTLLLGLVPHIQFAWMVQEADYDWGDLAPVAHMYREGSAIIVGPDTPWDNLQELIDDARERPDEISFGVSALTSPFYLALLDLEEATGVDLNIVNFDDNPRTAVVSGEIDGTHGAILASQPIREQTKWLAVQHEENRWPELTGDAPTVEEALEGVEVPDAILVHVGLFASETCQESHPERYEALVDAAEVALTQEAYREDLAELGEEAKFDYAPPEEFEQFVEDQLVQLYDHLERSEDEALQLHPSAATRDDFDL